MGTLAMEPLLLLLKTTEDAAHMHRVEAAQRKQVTGFVDMELIDR